MDPTLHYNEQLTISRYPFRYSENELLTQPTEPLYNTKRLDYLKQLQESYSTKENFLKWRLERNPYEGIGNSCFMNRAAIKLANLDWIFGFAKSETNITSFCDLCMFPGGFTEYIQYRQKTAYGFGISLKTGLVWNTKPLDLSRFEILFGPDGSGDLLLHSNWFTQKVLQKFPDGVDLCVADGGIESEDPSTQEHNNLPLILSECKTAISILRPGGSFVVKLFDSLSEQSAKLLFSLSQCFDHIEIVKPVSSRHLNAERYLFAFGFLPKRKINFDMDDGLSIPFIDWITYINNLSIETRILYSESSIDWTNRNKYRCYQCLILWHLPSSLNSANLPSGEQKNKEEKKIKKK